MHDSNKKQLKAGDQFYCARYGICTVKEVRPTLDVGNHYMRAENSAGDGFGYNQGWFDAEMPEAVKVRSWKELAAEAIAVQGACNLSDVVHSFSTIISEVCIRLNAEGKAGTENVNKHPICILFSIKIASLTMSEEKFPFAYNLLKDLVEG